MITIFADSFTINIGKNAKENWKLLEEANKNDIWFHLNDNSSPYVIIEYDNNYKLKHKDLKLAGRLCKAHSKEKNSKNVEVCYLEVRYVKKGQILGEAILLKEPKLLTIK